MATNKVRLNSKALQQYLDGEHGVEQMLEQEAQAIAQRAQSTAPVASGAYRDSIHVETDRTDRMVKRVVSDLPYAMAVEARAGVLAKSLDAAGS